MDAPFGNESEEELTVSKTAKDNGNRLSSKSSTIHQQNWH